MRIANDLFLWNDPHVQGAVFAVDKASSRDGHSGIHIFDEKFIADFRKGQFLRFGLDEMVSNRACLRIGKRDCQLQFVTSCEFSVSGVRR